ncbi:MAG TPA: molybdopterin-dependent oxidoreductase [Acidimicrobiia bacterium]
MVDRPYQIDFYDLLDMRMVEMDVTLSCVSNPIGGDLVGNARWLGVPLSEMLDRAGVDPVEITVGDDDRRQTLDTQLGRRRDRRARDGGGGEHNVLAAGDHPPRLGQQVPAHRGRCHRQTKDSARAQEESSA